MPKSVKAKSSKPSTFKPIRREALLADFFGRQTLKNERDATQIPWEKTIENEIRTYQGTKKEDFESMPLKLDAKSVAFLRKGGKLIREAWGLEQWQAENVMLCLCLKYAFGGIAG